MDCKFYSGDLSGEDRELLEKMLEKYSAETMLKSWFEEGHVGRPSGHGGVDSEKVKAVEILRRRAFCLKEKVCVTPVDDACFAWKPRDPRSIQSL